jgi:hypothetical protein
MGRIGCLETSETPNLSCLTPKKSDDLICTAVEVGNHDYTNRADIYEVW